MGKKNYLIEGVSGTGKSSVCNELKIRGYRAIDGDKDLAYQGDPKTGKPTTGFGHSHHIWNIDKVNRLINDKDEEVTFFCGGSRNFSKFIDLFDEVFVLDVDADTLNKRLDERPGNVWGKSKEERDLILELHRSKSDIPAKAINIDATKPLKNVVDEILGHIG